MLQLAGSKCGASAGPWSSFGMLSSMASAAAAFGPGRRLGWQLMTLDISNERAGAHVAMVDGVRLRKTGFGLFSLLRFARIARLRLAPKSAAADLSNSRVLVDGVRFELTGPLQVRRFSRPLP